MMTMDQIDLKKMEDDFMGSDDEEESLPQDVVGKEVDITKDGGVKKKILVAGEGWEQPQKNDKVSVHYTGKLVDGTQFDSSVDRGTPFEFQLGAGKVIKGWDEGVASMKKGEKSIFTLTADYAYGENGSPPTIPGGATLIFEIELLSWISINDLSPEKDGSILKFVEGEGDIGTWDRPQPVDIVIVKYSANVLGVEQFFVTDEQAEFKVEEGHFCPAMAVAVQNMTKGEKVKLKVAPKHAFGDAGREGVPPDSTIEIHLELVHVKIVKNVDPDKNGTVVKTISKEGVNYQTPNNEATVTVSWTGVLEDGTEFDKVERKQLVTEREEFPCEGLELAVLSMKAAEVADVAIYDPAMAFGASGISGKVPPNAVVKYHVELHEFQNGKETWQLDNSEKIELAEKRKAQGNKAFKEGKFAKAQRLYKKADETISVDKNFSDAEMLKLKEIQTSCALNLAAAALKVNDHKAAISAANRVLEKNPVHVKALFRRCQAYTETGDFVEAETDIKAALLLEADNKDLQLAKRKLKQRMKTQNKQDAKLFGAMFSKVGDLYAAPVHSSGMIPEFDMDGDGEEPNPTIPEGEMSDDETAVPPLGVKEVNAEEIAA